MPPKAVDEDVPAIPPGVELMVTDAEELVTRLPLASCICTTTAGVSARAAVPLDGWPVNNTLFAGPGPIPTAVLDAFARPVDVARKVYVPAAVNTRMLNVATPFTAFAVTVPPTPVPPTVTLDDDESPTELMVIA